MYTQYIFMYEALSEREKGVGRLKKEKGSETRASSGPVSSERASGILSLTHPSLGRFNLARQERLQVSTLQASFQEKILTSTLFVCLTASQIFSVRIHSTHCQACQRK